MSAVVSNQGTLFLTETGTRSAALAGAFLSETVTTGGPVALVGDLAPSVVFTANLTETLALTGDLAPVVTFAADLTVATGGPGGTVDLAGNLGGISHYGRLKYGVGHYSRIDAFAPILAGDLDIVGQDFFNGDLRPVVTFAGALTAVESLTGDLAPVVTFAGDFTLVPYVDFAGNLTPLVALGGDLGLVAVLAGDLAPQIDLGGLLGLDQSLEAVDGSFGFTVVLEASELISGPLWAATEPCPTPPWGSSEPCPPSIWTPVDPCDPVEWEDTELCNG